MSEYNANIRADDTPGAESINDDDTEEILDDLNGFDENEVKELIELIMRKHKISRLFFYEFCFQEDRRFITVGVCAQWKKIKAKPMEEILTRLEQFEFIRTVIFPENIIQEKPVDEWPFCHALISFHSKGFPLAKAQEYVRLHQPFLINDLDRQWDIMDRVKVHETLREAGIAQPRYGVIRRALNPGSFLNDFSFVFNHQYLFKTALGRL